MSGEYPFIIPYQVDFSTTTTGKLLPPSKRHLYCQFGITHIPSLLSGKTDVHCRGYEFQLHLVQSFSSGKYCLYFNQTIINQTILSYKQRRDYTYTYKIPNTIIKDSIITIRSYSMKEPWVQVSLNGENYIDFWKLYELGEEKMLSKYQGVLDRMFQMGRVKMRVNENDDEKYKKDALSRIPVEKLTNKKNDDYDSNETYFAAKASTWDTLVKDFKEKEENLIVDLLG